MTWRRGGVARWSLAAVMSAAAVCGVPTARTVRDGVLVAPVAAQFLEKPTRPQVETPRGPVRHVIFKSCTSCHGIDDYAYSALDRAGWNALIETRLNDLDVPLANEDRDLLLDWVVAKFGPNTKPFPRAYVPPQITTFFSDPDAQALLSRACTSCHGVERVNEKRYSPDRWRVVTVDMRERGAKVTDEELERLVEWLGRVRGTNPNQ